MFLKITDNEIINFNHVTTIHKRHNKVINSFTICICTVGEDYIALEFETEEEMEEKWKWLQLNMPK